MKLSYRSFIKLCLFRGLSHPKGKFNEGKYLQKVPTWYKDFKKYDVVLSDDIDGLVSKSALKFAKN